MHWNWQEMWQHMGAPALIVAGILIAMGFASLLVFVERCLFFARARRGAKVFVSEVAPELERADFERVAEVTRKFADIPTARVIGAAAQTFEHARAHGWTGGLSPLEKTQRHMERSIEVVTADLRRGFAVLASVGSTAPFVGLLGTVLGIITAFQGIASSGSGGLSAVSAGIAEALVETALGLTVAIPAVLAFHFLSNRASEEEMRIKNALGEFLDRLEDLGDEPPLPQQVTATPGRMAARTDARPKVAFAAEAMG